MAWALARSPDYSSASPDRDRIFCAPGNAGTEAFARNLPIDPLDAAALVAACRELDIHVVLVGPESALAAGVVDVLESAGHRCFGPAKKSAALESSKAFARAFALRQGIPCARTDVFSEPGSFLDFLDSMRGTRLVLKKSGLAAGKGVLDSDDHEELRRYGLSVLESDTLLAEEFLEGRELSVFALCDLSDRLLLPACADHKKALPGNRGPNTGGMGAVCPVPFADRALMSELERSIVDPTFIGMAREGLMYRGVLFFGIIVTASGPRLLEYNVRFGDPETQSLLPLLDSSFLELCSGTAAGRLCSMRPRFSDELACGVVVAAPGYPGSYPKGLAVTIEESESSASMRDGRSATALGSRSLLFHAATAKDPDGRIRTGGGRCFTAVGVAESWAAAREAAYATADSLHFEGAWYRPDIGSAYYDESGSAAS